MGIAFVLVALLTSSGVELLAARFDLIVDNWLNAPALFDLFLFAVAARVAMRVSGKTTTAIRVTIVVAALVKAGLTGYLVNEALLPAGQQLTIGDPDATGAMAVAEGTLILFLGLCRMVDNAFIVAEATLCNLGTVLAGGLLAVVATSRRS